METTDHERPSKVSEKKFFLFASIIYFIIAGVILVRNIPKSTWLIGWDNLLPEFNFSLNISRSLTAVWQEYQSNGLLGGMGHASALPREFILWLFSLVIPAHLLRYTWTGLMLFLGMLGTYVLVKSILKNVKPYENMIFRQVISMIAGLYYIANMATVQIFRAPFEAFITHHGALPWLLWGAYTLITAPTPFGFGVFAALSFFLSTQGYIPTLFLVYLILISAMSVILFLSTKHKKTTVKNIIIVFAIVVCTNAYWLMPSAFFTLTKSAVTVNAKINQMATDEVYLRNKKFGDAADVLTLRNFWFDNVEYNPLKGALLPMMQEWNTQYNNPLIYALLIITAGIIIGGFLISLTNGQTIQWGVLGVISFGMLAINTQPFSSIMNWLRSHVPLLSQFFRFPFTKWGSSVALFYAILFALAIWTAVKRLPNKGKIILIVASLVIIVIPVFPIFQGKLFSDRVTIQIPQEYFSLFSFMNAQPMGRAAILPQQTYWDWKYYDWGDLGSGFLWYGIKQPILDRAFDVWSAESENYYWEMSHAIYSKNSANFYNVLTKYDIKYIIVDKHVVSSGHGLSLATSNIDELITQIPQLKPAFSQGRIRTYINTGLASRSFISLSKNVPTVTPPYQWSEFDAAYQDVGTYIAKNASSAISGHNNGTIVYPYRDLFTKRSVSERNFSIKESDTAIDISPQNTSTNTAILKNTALVYDSNGQSDLTTTNAYRCGLFEEGTSNVQMLDDSGQKYMRFTDTNEENCLSYGIPHILLGDGYLVAVTSRHLTGEPLDFSMVNMTAKHTELETFLPTNTTWKTTYFILPPLAKDGLGYNPYISNNSIGNNTSINDIQRIRIYKIPYEQMAEMKTVSGSIASSSAIPNADLDVDHPNPAFYKVTLQNQNRFPIRSGMTNTLILSQSFDNGWIAVTPSTTFPFLKPAGKHILVNNWENGWQLNNPINESNFNKRISNGNTTIYIFFWPQLLEWFGFLLLPIPFFVALKSRKKMLQ